MIRSIAIAATILGLLISSLPATSLASDDKINLKLFAKSEVDRSGGCSVALWQSDRDPYSDEFAYLFIEHLDGDHRREKARIKIGNKVVSLQRIAIGGANNGYDLFARQLYKMPEADSYVVLELDLGEEEGEAVPIEGGTMTIVMPDKKPFTALVKGGAGCMSAAAADPVEDEFAGLFRQYEVQQIPAGFARAVQEKFGCNAAVMDTGVRGFQMSEESAIWEVPCEAFAYQANAVYALVYLPDPSAQHEFLEFQIPKGRPPADGTLMSPEWDVRRREVISVSLGRADGGCGTYERHRVSEDGVFELMEYREKESCDGKVVAPEKFPLVFKR